MTELLKLSKAARLAGVSRKEIQSKIRSGELQTFEGEVKITDLLRVFPQIDLDYDPTLEQMERIKANASAKFPWQHSEPPSSEILLRRLQTLTGLLVKTKTALDHNIQLLTKATDRLGELASDENQQPTARDQLYSLRGWLHENMSKPEMEPDDAAVLYARNLLLHIVSPTIQFVPSGHECLIEGGDNILDAALKSGKHVNYGCSDGSCGACKARLISGQVLETQSAAYEMSKIEGEMGYLLMCCNTPITDLVLEAAEVDEAASVPVQNISTRVSALQDLSEERVLVHLKPQKSAGFRYFAGQSATLEVGGTTKTLPMISCPCDRDNLQFILNKNRDDFANQLKAGDTIDVSGPQGNFVLRENSTNPSLFVACGDGFAPIKSLIEHAISIDQISAIHLYLFSTPDMPKYYHNLCRSWADAFDNFTYRNIKLADDPASATLDLTRAEVDINKLDAYVAGPKDFSDAITKALTNNKLPAERLRVEVLPD